MPSDKTNKKVNKPRKTKGKTSKRKMKNNGVLQLSRPSILTQRGINPFPDIFKVKLPWAHTGAITPPTTFTCGAISFEANAMPYPDTAAGLSSVQPRGLDQLSPLYNRYRTTGALIELTFSDPQNDHLMVGLRVRSANQVATAGLTWDQIATQPNTYYKPIVNTGNQIVGYKIFVKPNVLMGNTAQQLKYDPGYVAITSGVSPFTLADTIPTKRTFVDVWAYNKGTTAQNVAYTMKITYYCDMMRQNTFFDV